MAERTSTLTEDLARTRERDQTTRARSQRTRVPSDRATKRGRGQGRSDTQASSAAPAKPRRTKDRAIPKGAASGDGRPASWAAHDALLRLAADTVDDLERGRIATENRIRAAEQEKGMAALELLSLAELLEAQKRLEEQAIKDLRTAIRAHPMGDWIKRTTGVGEKQGARLLAAVGNPLEGMRKVEGDDDEVTYEPVERSVSRLWAYCGMHVVDGKAPKRTRGQKSNWSPEARMRARLIADSCNKVRCKACTAASRSREDTAWAPPPPDCTCERDGYGYRAIYDKGRAKYQDADISDLHRHNRALRLVAKAVLRDLWEAAGDAQKASPVQA